MNKFSLSNDMQYVFVKSIRTGRYIAIAEVATTLEAQIKGLLGRSEFAKGCGLLIPFSNQIHSQGMQFPFDAVFLDNNNIVVHIIKSMPKNMLSPKIVTAAKVLELPGGTIHNGNLLQGDMLEIQ